MDIINIIKTIIWCVYILFIPGFIWSYVLFYKGEIDLIERIAVSFGLSVSVVPLTVFWMNYFFKIKITFANVTIIVLILIISGICTLYIRNRW